MLTLLAPDDRRKNLEPGALRQLHHPVNHLVDALLMDFLPAFRAVGNADSRPEKTEIVVNLRNGSDCGPGIFRRCLLIDGNGRREAVNIIHIRFVHLAEEHPGVGAQALHIPPLPFGIHRVKRQAALSRAGFTGDHHQLVPGDFHIDILEVIFSCAFNKNAVLHAGISLVPYFII